MQDSLDDKITWVPLLKNVGDFKLTTKGVMMNNHFMKDSDSVHTAFVDSGTTFSYFPYSLFNIISDHFDWFCSVDSVNHCKGKRI